MAKNKTKTKYTKPKRTALKKGKPMKNTAKEKMAKKRGTPKKKLATKKAALKKVAVKTTLGKMTTGAKSRVALRKRVRRKGQSVDTEAFAVEGPQARSGGQCGDSQGLSNLEGADSESVGELIEEGNAFEADAVMGVEDAGDTDKEVRTHEVPQDDVPGEYHDKE
jgi:hypothetical protein